MKTPERLLAEALRDELCRLDPTTRLPLNDRALEAWDKVFRRMLKRGIPFDDLLGGIMWVCSPANTDSDFAFIVKSASAFEAKYDRIKAQAQRMDRQPLSSATRQRQERWQDKFERETPSGAF